MPIMWPINRRSALNLLIIFSYCLYSVSCDFYEYIDRGLFVKLLEFDPKRKNREKPLPM